MDDDVMKWTAKIEYCIDLGRDENWKEIVSHYYAVALRDGNGSLLFESPGHDTPEEAEKEFDLSREEIETAIEEFRAKHRERY